MKEAPKHALESVAAVFNGKTPSRIQQRKSGHPVLKIKDVTEQGIFVGCFDSFVDEDLASKFVDKQIQLNDILILNAAHSAGHVGSKIYRAEQHVVGALATGEWLVVRPNPEVLDPIYTYYWIMDGKTRHLIRRLVRGIHLYPSDVGRLRIPLPPLLKQHRIVAILEKAYTVRRKRQEAINLADELLCSVFLEMFGDPVINPHKWNIKPLGNIAIRFSDGPFGSNLKTSHYVDEGIRVVRLQNIRVDEFLDEDKAYISKDHFQTLLKHKCVPGDVIIGTLGNPNLRACILPSYIDKALNKADCIQLRTDHNQATPEYICSLINHPGMLTLAYHLMHGQTRTRVSMGALKELEVPIPPLSIQKHYSIIYYQKRRITSQHKNIAIKTGTLFNFLTQRAFRGEL